MSKKVSIIGGVLGGLASLIPEAKNQILGRSKPNKQKSGSTHYHIHNHLPRMQRPKKGR